MKKNFKSLLASLLLCASFISSSSAVNLGSLTPQEAKTYENTLNSIQNQYGSAQIHKESGFLQGLSMAKLVDFNGDNKPEIYCVARASDSWYKQWIYGFNNGQLFKHSIEQMTNLGTDVSPQSIFYIGDKKSYIVIGSEEMNGNEISFSTLDGTELKPAFRYRMSDSGIYEVNGISTSEYGVNQAINDFTSGLKLETYDYYESSYYATTSTVSETRKLLKTLTAPVANKSNSSFILNDKNINIPAYNINNNNYFKLRDLAAILSGTNKQFEVAWDNNIKSINLVSNSPYTYIGGELETSHTSSKNATLNQSKIYLDGKEIALTAYTIDGNNYFKLRDIAKVFNFGVTWNSNKNSIIVDTNKTYTD